MADQSWQIAGIGDFDGDGKDDILWRNASTGENYLYPMDGTSIKPTEGFENRARRQLDRRNQGSPPVVFSERWEPPAGRRRT